MNCLTIQSTFLSFKLTFFHRMNVDSFLFLEQTTYVGGNAKPSPHMQYLPKSVTYRAKKTWATALGVGGYYCHPDIYFALKIKLHSHSLYVIRPHSDLNKYCFHVQPKSQIKFTCTT